MAQSALRDVSPTWWKDIKPQAPQKPVGQQMSDVLGGMALATAPIPIVGDVAGAVSDAAMYAAYPEERTMLNAGMSLAGLLPFVPGPGGVRAAEKAADALDMSTAARMQRANEGRFFPNTLYHGTSTSKSDGWLYDEFALFEGDDLSRSVSRSPVGKLGVSIAENPNMAADFARQASPVDGTGAAMLPLRFRADRIASIDLVGDEKNDEIYNTVVDAWKNGFDAIRFKNYTSPLGTKGNFFLVKNPNQIRSVAASFDPAKRGSANLMAGAAGGAIGLSALRNINQQEEK